jgi:hypothetical protein
VNIPYIIEKGLFIIIYNQKKIIIKYKNVKIIEVFLMLLILKDIKLKINRIIFTIAIV